MDALAVKPGAYAACRAAYHRRATQVSLARCPTAGFWSFTVYDNQTRSMLQTDQQFPAVGSLTKGLLVNADAQWMFISDHRLRRLWQRLEHPPAAVQSA